MRQLYVRSLEQIQGSLKAASDDCGDELHALKRGETVDIGMLDGALFHAEEAIGTLKRLIAAINSTVEGGYTRTEDTKTANHIDGYDRDDLGESPDY